MDHPRLESGVGERTFGRQEGVVRSFDDDNHVLDVMLSLDLANLLDRQPEEYRSMLKRLGFYEQVPKVIGHHPLRSVLGRIDADDGEASTAHVLDAGAENAVRLLERLPACT